LAHSLQKIIYRRRYHTFKIDKKWPSSNSRLSSDESKSDRGAEKAEDAEKDTTPAFAKATAGLAAARLIVASGGGRGSQRAEAAEEVYDGAGATWQRDTLGGLGALRWKDQVSALNAFLPG
jgi:hypothetical protein